LAQGAETGHFRRRRFEERGIHYFVSNKAQFAESACSLAAAAIRLDWAMNLGRLPKSALIHPTRGISERRNQ